MYKNHIDLIGFVGSDPEARHTSNGTAVTAISLDLSCYEKQLKRTALEHMEVAPNGIVLLWASWPKRLPD